MKEYKYYHFCFSSPIVINIGTRQNSSTAAKTTGIMIPSSKKKLCHHFLYFSKTQTQTPQICLFTIHVITMHAEMLQSRKL